MSRFHRPARGLLIARQRIVGTLPWRDEIEIAEFLSEPYRRVGDALLLVVPAHLDKTGQREVLAQGMAFKAVVGEQPAQIRMALEHDAIEIIGLALEPVGARKDIDDGSDRTILIDLDLDANTPVPGRRQQMVDDVEAVRALRPVHRREIDKGKEGAARIIAQECDHPVDLGRLGRDRELAPDNGIAADRAGERAGNRLTEGVERVLRHRVVTARSSRCA